MNHPSKADWANAQALILAQQQLINELREEHQNALGFISRRVGDFNLNLISCDHCGKWDIYHYDCEHTGNFDCLGCSDDGSISHEYCDECVDSEFCSYNRVCKLHFAKCDPDCPGGHNKTSEFNWVYQLK